MDKKSACDDSNIDLNSELLTNFKRSKSDNEWFKHLFTPAEHNLSELQSSKNLYNSSGNSQLRFLMAEGNKKFEPEYKRESDAYDELRRISLQAGGLVGLSALSRLNSMINDELVLDKRASINSDNQLDDFSLLKAGFTANSSNISVSGMEMTKPALTDTLHPFFNRTKSNDSFALLMTRNFSNPQVIEYNNQANTFKTDYPNFGNLLKLLKKHFNGDEITNKDLDLSTHELEIIGAIITRKYKGKINTPTKNYFLSTIFTDIGQLKSSKRPEENYKFIFKRCLKYMKERLNIYEKKKMGKKQLEDYFYQYYFAETCKKYKISMDITKYPLKGRGTYTTPKTISAEYVSKVGKSQEFVKDFNSYMSESLKKDYEASISPKLDSIVKRWEEIFAQIENKQDALQQIIDYVLKNKKCKFPWTEREIDAAMEAVRVIFSECCTTKDGN